MNLIEKTLGKEYKYKGRIINLRVDDIELPDKQKATREVIEHNGGVSVVAVTENNEILLVKQYRYPYSEVITEIPAGKLNKGEDLLECAKRELAEETGATAKEWEFLGEVYPTPAYCEEILYIYMAQDLSFGEQNLDEDEFLEVMRLPISEAKRKALSGEFKDAKTIVGILRACDRLNQF
ncbi:MAG: NUDIX hydrolase [Ruminococcaceae bacterium]|nr:NUDIX hydrolase [Oscillospiraceae bacterium]